MVGILDLPAAIVPWVRQRPMIKVHERRLRSGLGSSTIILGEQVGRRRWVGLSKNTNLFKNLFEGPEYGKVPVWQKRAGAYVPKT